MKIKNDAYFTPSAVVELGWKLIEEHIGLENITEIVESSAGAGAWLRDDLNIPFLAYDIEPQSENIEIANFLELPLNYKPGRLVGFNPPFGPRNNLSRKFFKKSVEIADYIVFVQPISQLNNEASMYEFDLICSIDLGVQHYTDRDLHCCLNIWRRPQDGTGLNKKPTIELSGIKIIKGAYGKKIEDYSEGLIGRLGFFGMGNCGKWIDMNRPQTSSEYWFYGDTRVLDIDFRVLVRAGCGSPGISMMAVKKLIKENLT